MPFYEYECSNCHHHVEMLQKMSDAPLRKCPSCGKSALKKLMSAPVFRLKGSGWYETDFKSDKEQRRNLAGAEREAEGASGAADTKDVKDVKDVKEAKDAKGEAKPAGAASESGKAPAAAPPADSAAAGSERGGVSRTGRSSSSRSRASGAGKAPAKRPASPAKRPASAGRVATRAKAARRPGRR